MKNLKSALSRFLKDESGQGATEYILLLVVVVAVVLLFKDKIKGILDERLQALGDGAGSVTTSF